MIITRKDLKTTFESLRIGTVFEYDGQIFMKTTFNVEQFQAVILADGTLWNFENDTLVAPLEAELIIRGAME